MYTIQLGKAYGQEIGEDGPYTAERIVVEAVSPSGEVYWHFKTFTKLRQAQTLCDKVAAHVWLNPSWEPNENWTFNRCIYGSISYCMNGGEHDLQRADVEAEYGPGSYQPSHSGFLQ
jgi:hypothetical protein